jgi:hypothetical protein
LAEGIIRTPLPAETTFMDDPLRILRAIRFASRLEFALHADIVAAATLPRVRVALGSKISRERIGKEVEGMLSGTHILRPLLAFRHRAAPQSIMAHLCTQRTHCARWRTHWQDPTRSLRSTTFITWACTTSSGRFRLRPRVHLIFSRRDPRTYARAR